MAVVGALSGGLRNGLNSFVLCIVGGAVTIGLVKWLKVQN